MIESEAWLCISDDDVVVLTVAYTSKPHFRSQLPLVAPPCDYSLGMVPLSVVYPACLVCQLIPSDPEFFVVVSILCVT